VARAALTELGARPSRGVAILRRPAFLWPAVIVGLPLLVYLALHAPVPFVQMLWDAQVEALDVRHRMADRLVEARSLQGKTRAEVIELLGKPDALADGNGDMIYVLGDERSFLGIDRELLAIRFDASGTVTAAKIRTD
jgi:hypothetical protein